MLSNGGYRGLAFITNQVGIIHHNPLWRFKSEWRDILPILDEEIEEKEG